ncbi:hypothetical protein [Streptomyces sp. WM6372]|uniref:hypothetical protein n=1 Tax=Streptomyces sp. WM6372 TaxID=1415555 RepID=UPI0006B047B0|nr:hypothetical protein [Streptomyces sp. WM6372]
MRRKAVQFLAIALSTAAFGIGAASAAQAGDYNTDGVRIRQTPYTSDTRVNGLGYRSQTITPICYSEGTNVSGNPFWTKHKNNNTGVVGFASETLLNKIAQPHC